MRIIPLDFIDVSKMTAALVMKHAVRFRDDTRRQDYTGSPHHDTETILLRGPENPDGTNWFEDVPHADTDILAGWPTARGVIDACAESHKRRSGLIPDFGKIMVVALKPGGIVDWHTDQGGYAAAHDRFHICMIPSPGAFIYSGGEQSILPVGQLTFLDNHVPHSAVNFGNVARTHLIFDLRRLPPATLQ